MKDILQEIIAAKRIEVERHKQAVPLSTLLALSQKAFDRPTISMHTALQQSASGIIAEFKRKSPSKGWLHPDAKVEEVLPMYEQGEASACSILTDGPFFGGMLGDLNRARRLVNLPLLRKDFVIDPYQIYQARAMGADAILLIAACLTPSECQSLAALAHKIGLETLLETHREEELIYLTPDIDMLGVNNRNLGTFHTDVANSLRMAEALQRVTKEQRLSPVLVSESGISQPETVRQLREAGYRGFLIGETFMKTEQPGATLKAFIQRLK